MNKENFKEGSVERIIFEYWDEAIDNAEFRRILNKVRKEDLIDFIMDAQSRGRFGDGYIHE